MKKIFFSSYFHSIIIILMKAEAFLKSHVLQDLKTDLFVTEGVRALTNEQLPKVAASFWNLSSRWLAW